MLSGGLPYMNQNIALIPVKNGILMTYRRTSSIFETLKNSFFIYLFSLCILHISIADYIKPYSKQIYNFFSLNTSLFITNINNNLIIELVTIKFSIFIFGIFIGVLFVIYSLYNKILIELKIDSTLLILFGYIILLSLFFTSGYDSESIGFLSKFIDFLLSSRIGILLFSTCFFIIWSFYNIVIFMLFFNKFYLKLKD